ncbi:MAG: hypothetical protein WDN03_11675 [Rhizomicrobium sp.]
MNLVLGFVPFILFAVLMRLSTDLALWIAFAAAFTLGMRSFLDTRVLKTLDAATPACSDCSRSTRVSSSPACRSAR